MNHKVCFIYKVYVYWAYGDFTYVFWKTEHSECSDNSNELGFSKCLEKWNYN